MAKYAKAGERKVKPENDWRVLKTWIVDHWTGAATEINGVGEVRNVERPCAPIDADLRVEMDKRHAEMHARRVAERERRLKESEALLSKLRREYQARGRVLTLADLMRELKRIAREKDQQPARNTSGVPSVGEALVDEFANAPIVRVGGGR